MTLQQLRYIVAIDRFRNFAKAADACDISQPTLSAMLIKLEEELDVRIFERTNKSVKPTTEGAKIIFSGLKEGSTKASIAASDGTTHNFNITVRKSASGSGWL